ncbi:MAG: hypothetical protein AAGA03_09285, partial [Planctomycetota bacterium]
TYVGDSIRLKTATKPQASKPAPEPPSLSRMAIGPLQNNWVARDAINKIAPLTDPVPEPSSTRPTPAPPPKSQAKQPDLSFAAPLPTQIPGPRAPASTSSPGGWSTRGESAKPAPSPQLDPPERTSVSPPSIEPHLPSGKALPWQPRSESHASPNADLPELPPAKESASDGDRRDVDAGEASSDDSNEQARETPSRPALTRPELATSPGNDRAPSDDGFRPRGSMELTPARRPRSSDSFEDRSDVSRDAKSLRWQAPKIGEPTKESVAELDEPRTSKPSQTDTESRPTTSMGEADSAESAITKAPDEAQLETEDATHDPSSDASVGDRLRQEDASDEVSDSETTLQPGQSAVDRLLDQSKTNEAVSLPKRRPTIDGPTERLAETPERQPNEATRPESMRVEDLRRADEVPPSTIQRDYTGRATRPIQVGTAARQMQNSIASCLRYYYARPEKADGRSNWGMLHSIMVYGIDTKVIAGRRQFNAIAWMAGNNFCRGKRLLTEGPRGIEVREGIGLQGHQAQMLAVFSLVGVPQDYPLYVGDHKYSIQDVIRREQLDCREGAELTFTLIGLSHYLDTDVSWRASDGEIWDFERVIRQELAEPVAGAACGGTHRLMGFAHALRKRRAEGKPITGQWSRAERYLDDFISYTYRLQNRDGSMSTSWFEARADNGDLDRKVQTTGHMVEFLLTVTPDDQLQDPRLLRAIRFLSSAMTRYRTRDWSVGPKGHSLRSLAMFYSRLYKSDKPWNVKPASVASRNPTRRSRR